MKPIKHAFLAAAATLTLTGPLAAQTSNASGNVSVSLECAQRDVQLVTQLEQLGEAQTLPGYVLYETFMTIQRARAACNEGRMADGLAIYDGIVRPILAQKKQ